MLSIAAKLALCIQIKGNTSSGCRKLQDFFTSIQLEAGCNSNRNLAHTVNYDTQSYDLVYYPVIWDSGAL